MINAKVIGGVKLQTTLKGFGSRAKNLGPALAIAGYNLSQKSIPESIRFNEGGWPQPHSWPLGYRSNSRPLMDTGRLAGSIAYIASPRTLKIYTNVPYAAALNEGATIKPKGSYLLVPLSPPLSPGEAKGFPRGKAAIRSAYPGSYFGNGPGGFGVHRAGDKQLIAAAIRGAKIPQFRWLWWRPKYRAETRWIVEAYMVGVRYGVTATERPMSGGNADIGR